MISPPEGKNQRPAAAVRRPGVVPRPSRAPSAANPPQSLADVAVAAGCHETFFVTGHRGGRHKNDRHTTSWPLHTADQTRRFQSVKAGHLHIHQNRVVVLGLRGGDRFAAIIDEVALVAVACQKSLQESPHGRGIVGHQEPQRSWRIPGHRAHRRRERLDDRPAGQVHREPRASPGFDWTEMLPPISVSSWRQIGRPSPRAAINAGKCSRPPGRNSRRSVPAFPASCRCQYRQPIEEAGALHRLSAPRPIRFRGR